MTNESKLELDPDGPAVLAEVENEFQANVIIGELKSHGINASTTGNFTAGFRAEAPGLIQIVVSNKDFVAATKALEQIRQSDAEIDKSKVDVGKPID